MIYRVSVDTQDGFRAGRPELMFAGLYRPYGEPNFNVSRDGQYFLYTRIENPTLTESDTPVLVENWFNRLRQLASAN